MVVVSNIASSVAAAFAGALKSALGAGDRKRRTRPSSGNGAPSVAELFALIASADQQIQRSSDPIEQFFAKCTKIVALFPLHPVCRRLVDLQIRASDNPALEGEKAAAMLAVTEFLADVSRAAGRGDIAYLEGLMERYSGPVLASSIEEPGTPT